ncbi:dTDP-4-dehydrorhamnose reductase [Paracoccus spongiarum]|uniref:dTDP-4-dehydrorhamnose reductase n=1 Tax=Paracoccus spongiarum TaxID=3064387 RepID=A0ABT9JBZ5_9RHOB|nr:dTDP-4-dehydrorhamnose reductase [Paracoccus sp. 2205BS29-5]MDP5307125.1 dTDP-4-dehydrorhamnose reductase [Paracoccus sp. 2205BS29-5]
MQGVLVFGKTGQVARELALLAPEAQFLGRDEADLADPEGCADALLRARPSLVINAAAYTAVDRAESEPDIARSVNALSPGAMARAAAALDVPFLHVSTDYVFDGSGTAPWIESAATAPLGVYGATKLAGEQAVAAARGRSVILRTSWVFSAHGANFVKTMLRLGAVRDEIAVVADQIGGPTPAAGIAATLLHIGRAMAEGRPAAAIYHYAGAPDASWADFAAAIFAQAGLACRVRPIPGADYPTPARRPQNSRLDCGAIARDFAVSRPDWRKGLADVLARLEQTT